MVGTQGVVDPGHRGRPDTTPGFIGFRDLDELERVWERRQRSGAASADRRGQQPGACADGAGTRELCHDLRQPLAAAAALARALEAGLDGVPVRVQEQLALLRSQLEQASGIVAGGLAAPAPRLVALETLVRRASATLDATGSTPVEVVVLASPVVTGDPVELLRLLGNLLSNARRAAGPDGRVRVVLSVRGPEAVVEVDDDGAGAATASSTGTTSSGLGLLIVSGIASRHSAEVGSAPGDLGGLQVRVVLPVALPVQGQVASG